MCPQNTIGSDAKPLVDRDRSETPVIFSHRTTPNPGVDRYALDHFVALLTNDVRPVPVSAQPIGVQQFVATNSVLTEDDSHEVTAVKPRRSSLKDLADLEGSAVDPPQVCETHRQRAALIVCDFST
jgi:hypothetical protein